MDGLFELKYDENLARDLLAQQTKIHRNTLLTDPELPQEQGIEQIIHDFQQNYPKNLTYSIQATQKSIDLIDKEYKQVQSQINNFQEQINKLTAQKSLLTKQILPLYNQLLSMFPKNLHRYVEAYFDDTNYLLNHLYKNAGFWKKTFQKSALRKQFFDLYNKIIDLSGTTQPPTNTLNILDKKISALQSNIQGKKSHLKSLEQRKPSYDELLRLHNEYSLQMHTKIAEFMYAYSSYDQLRKNIPPILNTENLTEPVCFTRIITGISEQQLRKLLTHAGLKVGYKPSEYIIRKTLTMNGKECLELITPFYSPENAQQNITMLLQYLAAHNASFEGVVVPATYQQINPRPTQEINPEKIQFKIQQKMANAISVNAFCKKYEQQPNCLFRGQTFMTSDKNSSYATPTWRPGRTGIIYATANPHYATTYATTATNTSIAGKTMDTKYFPSINGYTVGMVTVYKRSPDNISVSDRALEGLESNFYSGPGNILDESTGFHLSETLLCPQKNPVMERYMIIGDKMMLVDENDTDWHEILDSFAPKLRVTHIFGPSRESNRDTNQSTHGHFFMQRIDQLESQAKETGIVKTYDITDDVMEKISPSRNRTHQFQSASHQINTSQTSSPSNTIQKSIEHI